MQTVNVFFSRGLIFVEEYKSESLLAVYSNIEKWALF